MANQQPGNNNGIDIDSKLLSLLKANDKGWKTTLFVDQNKVKDYICNNCNGVCNDAVELGCDIHHDDNDLYPYCKQCLIFLISNNNDKCILSSHPTPIISKTAALRRFISNTIVYCPYSIQYKQITNNHNGSDQKEGDIAPAAVYNLNNSNVNGCQWKGKLTDLIKDHFAKCNKIHNPSFELNLLLNQKNKENEELKMEITKLKEINKAEKHKVEALLAIIEDNEVQLILNETRFKEIYKKRNDELCNQQNKIFEQESVIKKLVFTITNKNQRINQLKSNTKQTGDSWIDDIRYEHFKFHLNEQNKEHFRIANDGKTVQWLGGLFNTGRMIMFGDFLTNKDKIKIRFEIPTVSDFRDDHRFGFVSPQCSNWYGCKYLDHGMVITGGGRVYATDEFILINNMNVYNGKIKSLSHLFDMSLLTNIIIISVDMKRRIGYIWNDKTKSIKCEVHLPDSVGIILGFAGINKIPTTATFM